MRLIKVDRATTFDVKRNQIMGADGISRPALDVLTGDVPRVVCPRVLVDGNSVIESSIASSEAYLLPEIHDIQTKLSMLSASSSVYVETGAPDIRHLTTLSSSADEEEQPMRIDGTSSGSEKGMPHLMASLKSSIKHNRSCCEVILTVRADEDRGQQIARSHNDGALSLRDRRSWDEGSIASIPVSLIQCTQGGSVEVEILEATSSITMSDSYSLLRPSVLDFSNSLMPEITPRNRNSTFRREIQGLTVVAPSPSRYQRPIDTLLISKKNPSPIPTHAALKHPQKKSFQRKRSISIFSDKSNGENFDPQSPLPQKEMKAYPFTPRTITSQNGF